MNNHIISRTLNANELLMFHYNIMALVIGHAYKYHASTTPFIQSKKETSIVKKQNFFCEVHEIFSN